MLKMFYQNGTDLDLSDEKGWRIIHHILKRGNHQNKMSDNCRDTLKYIIENDICSFDGECINVLDNDNFKDFRKQSIEILCNMIITNYDHWCVQFSALQSAILRDFDTIVDALLTSMLKRQKIESIEYYRENGVITFEFVFNLFKLCNNDGNNSKNCERLLKHWLQIIATYESNSFKQNHIDQYGIEIEQKYNSENENLYTCILCLGQIAMKKSGKSEQRYDYCSCCDFLICQNCKNTQDYQSSRV